MTKQIEEYIKENLIGEAQTTALEFVAFLRSNNIEFYKDNCSCWKAFSSGSYSVADDIAAFTEWKG